MRLPYQRAIKRTREDYVAQAKAGNAVSAAIHRGDMLSASAYLCVVCQKQAEDYHHPSYREEDRLCVIPLCTKCHIRHHRSGLQLPPLGVVPTSVGLIRIAIATSPEAQP